MSTHLTLNQLIDALSLRDLTDATQGTHAMQSLLKQLEQSVQAYWQCPVQLLRANPLVRVADNYDALGYPVEGLSRNSRYSRYLNEEWMLRTQTSSLVPGWLASWLDKTPRKLALISPGLVYRRDCIDRLHCSEPHQVDVWVVLPKPLAEPEEVLRAAATHLMHSLLPEHAIHLSPSPHPYTENGLQIDALNEQSELVEVGECGLIHPELLSRTGWDSAEVTGIAVGLGLDRLLMLRKHMKDIRLLRHQHPAIDQQMQDLNRWRTVSWQPKTLRDLSIAVDNDMDLERLGDQIRGALPEQSDWIEAVEWLGETPYNALPESARIRLGLRPDQKNVLVRLVIRHPTRSVTSEEANALRERVSRAVHEGEVVEV